MATAQVIPLPDPFPATINTVITPIIGQRSFSAASGAVVRSTTPRQLWQVEFDTELATLEESRLLRAFLVQLEGSVNVFRLPVPRYHNAPRPGPYTVAGGNQSGNSVDVDGFPANQVALQIGDYLTVNDELKIMRGDAVANGSGVASLPIWPPLRRSPADNAAVEAARPTLRAMRINEDGLLVGNRGHHQTKFICLEDVTYGA